MGRAQPSCASTYQPGLPSNQAPLVVVNRRGSPCRWNDVRTRIWDPSGDELEIEAGAKRLVAEAELHHLRLDDDAPPFEEREKVARVLAAHVDSDAPRPLILEAREQADRVAIGRRVLVLRHEQRAREKRDPRFGVEESDRQGSPGAVRRVCRPASPGAGTRSASAPAASPRAATRRRRFHSEPLRRAPEPPCDGRLSSRGPAHACCAAPRRRRRPRAPCLRAPCSERRSTAAPAPQRAAAYRGTDRAAR